ncbi:uncharacterized protein [Asterias amurensis]|uniref:uncharacterized protein n=1 Tax=Asterias amurensis TaxID=7602 RepID=UPI003AB83F06
MDMFPTANTSELSDDAFPKAGQPLNSNVRVFRVVVEILVVLLGVPGNLLIIRVYWRKTVKTSTIVLIQGLALADCIVCSVKIIDIIDQTVGIPQAIVITQKIVFMSVMASVSITTVIALDRYDCICRPQRRFFTLRRGQIAVVISFIFGALMTVPEHVQQFGRTPTPSVNLASLARMSSFLISPSIIGVCYTKVFMTIRRHVRVGIMSSANAANLSSSQVASSSKEPTRGQPGKDTVKTESECPNSVPHHDTSQPSTVHSSARKDTAPQGPPKKPEAFRHTARERNEPRLNPVKQRQAKKVDTNAALQRKTTVMLFVVSVVFLLLWMPHWIMIAVVNADAGEDEGIYVDPLFYIVMNEIRVLFFLNNAVNPFIYGLANRRFRKECKEVLSKLCK